MDRDRPVPRLLTGAAWLLLLLAAAADTPSVPMREARWFAPDALAMGLLYQPAECLRAPANEAERDSIAVGRAAFRAPRLLGGQGARAGLSCASCHRNGRGNPAFAFPGLSGDPGTADVTSSLMSSHRGDATINPRPIPDLVAPARLAPRDRASRKLEAFIRGLIVEEFDGPEPSAATLSGLADYVRAIDAAACPADATEPITLDATLADALTALDAARTMLARGDRATALLLTGAARSELGRIDERFQRPGLARSRARLARSDRALAAIEAALRTGSPAAPDLIARWDADWPRLRRDLRADEPRSFFAPDVLRQALAR